MKADNLFPVRIPAAEARRLNTWELPMMEGDLQQGSAFNTVYHEETVTVTDEEVVAEKLTLAEIEQIREDAFKEGFAQGREEGFEQGKADGYRQGYEQGLASGETEIKRQLALLDSLQVSFRQPIAEQEKALEGLLADLILRFAEAVVNAELQSSEAHIVKAVMSALEELPSTTLNCQVQVNPVDLDALERLAQREGFTLISDETITAGGCRLMTENSRVDHTVEARFQQVAEQLSAALGKYTSSAPQ
jgi:flagellar assembly protein FliH